MTRVECNESELFQFADLFCDSEMDMKQIEKAVADILTAIGEDANREGLVRTPDRVARAYREMLDGYRTDPIKLVNKALFSVEYDDMVIVRDIDSSACVSIICCHLLEGRMWLISRTIK